MRVCRCVILSASAAVAVAVWWTTEPLAGQASSTATKWTAPRTEWGDPDLQGLWTNFNRTPFEKNRADVDATEAEAKRASVIAHDGGDGGDKAPFGGTHPYWNEHSSPVSPRLASLVVDPPDGLVPFKRGVAPYRNYQEEEDTWESHHAFERCITRGVPGGMFPAVYNSAHQILQTPGYVVIVSEMIHEARIIPLDGRPHVGASVRLWNGDSRGHWEGSTLVIDTTNFNSKGVIRGGEVQNIPQSESLHVIERLTPLDANTVSYEVTIDDPQIFTRPWKVATPLNRDQKYQIFEFACHEGNIRYMEGVLRAGRVRDQRAAVAAKKKGR